MTDKKVNYTWKEFDEDTKIIVEKVKEDKTFGIYGIPKGGLPIAVRVANILNQPLLTSPTPNCLIIDDISDTGKQMLQIPNIYHYSTITIHLKKGTAFVPNFYCRECERKEWIVYPWERFE